MDLLPVNMMDDVAKFLRNAEQRLAVVDTVALNAIYVLSALLSILWYRLR